MSIKFNGKTVAGNYKIQLSTEATTAQKGLIRIATDEEAQLGKLEDVAITPKQLSEYGGGGSGSGGSTNTLVDDVTIVKDDDTDIITAVGIKTKNGEYLFDWVGTEEEYNTAIADGTIPENENWVCWITDDGTDVDDIIKNKADVNLSNLSEEGKAIVDSKASVDLDNLTTTGEKHFLNKSQITNCLLEVPQRIKLELVDGTLTLKTGSEVIIPNGFEADGVTPKFDYVTVESDTNVAATGGSGQVMISVQGGNFPQATAIKNCINGSNPTIPTYSLIYNTTNNTITRYSSDTTAGAEGSLPIAICTQTDSVITSIDQVFNGMGYIGSTVWVDKGVKGLIPNGRNEDGTLNNIEHVTSKLITRDVTDNGQLELAIHPPDVLTVYAYFTVSDENYLLGNNGARVTGVSIVSIYVTNNVITSFNPKQPFRITDNAVSKSGDTMTGNLFVEKETPIITLKNSNIESSVPPTADSGVSYFAIHDKNGQAMGQVGLERYTNGRNTIKLQAFSADGTFAPAIRVHANADNTASFNLSANPANTSNGTEIATTAFCDGNWTYKFLELAKSVVLSNTAKTTYSLASYLPNDGRTYEVLFSFGGSATAASQYNIDTGFGTVFCFAPIKTNISGCMILPVTTRRTIIIQPTTITGGTNTYSFRVNAYRKVR